MDNNSKAPDKYSAQKKYLSSRKSLRVWVSNEKYDAFKEAVTKNKKSIYGVINEFIDSYIGISENPKNKGC